MESIHMFIDKHGDPRANHYFGMSSPTPTVIISLIYLFGVTLIGPELMKNRRAFVLKKTLIWYNAFQVALNAYVFFRLFSQCRVLEEFSCGAGNTSSIYAAGASWWYFISKFTDFFDTIFFLMRKKTSQVTFLHVFHHTVMPLVSWNVVKFTPTGSPILFGATNAFVHVIMYSYYMLSAMGPEYQKLLNKYKPYITIMQIVQFIYVIAHSATILVTDCSLSKIPVTGTLIVCLLFLVMFSIFFKNTYKSISASSKTN